MQHIPPWMRQRGMLMAIAGLIIGTTLVVITLVGWSAQPAPAPAAEDGLSDSLDDSAPGQAPTSRAAAPTSIVVYVSGAVRQPDVYELPPEARVKDLVLSAGGLSEDADAERINLAERLHDEQHVHVPRLGEQAGQPDPSASAAGGAAQGDLVDLNTATLGDLDAINGIGPTLAQRIIDYRESDGPFTAVEDLQKVKGVGPALYAKIAPFVTVR